VDPNDLYLKNANKWWDGYNDHDQVLIDDLGHEAEFLVSYLKLWTDKYPFRPEIKQATLPPIRPRRFFVTSNYHPRELFKRQVDCDAICRRFKIVLMDEVYTD
jgi:hypothetical protein